ncbi:MAG: LemA family protein [Planctomycetota bacterium]
MEIWQYVLIGAGLLLAIIVFTIIAIYNRLVELGTRFKNGFAQIDVQLKRRHDLIPNLVEVAKGYMGHERGTLEAVIQARNQAVSGLARASATPGDASAMSGLAGSEGALVGAVSKLFAVAEAYPDLKANATMMQLSEELTSTENKVGFARQAYNDAATHFNTYRSQFPPVLFAGIFGFTADAALLEFEDHKAISQVPVVKF